VVALELLQVPKDDEHVRLALPEARGLFQEVGNPLPYPESGKGTQNLGIWPPRNSQAFEDLWLIRFHGRAALGVKAAVAPLFPPRSFLRTEH